MTSTCSGWPNARKARAQSRTDCQVGQVELQEPDVAIVFNGARIETGAEVEFNAVVYVNTVVPAGTAVPMGWFAGGQPAELVVPGDWDRIRAIMGPLLDYRGTVFGVGASGTGSMMPDVARRYARALALHNRDHILPDERHVLCCEHPH